MTAGWY